MEWIQQPDEAVGQEPNDDDVKLQNERYLLLELTAPNSGHRLDLSPDEVWNVVAHRGETPEISVRQGVTPEMRRGYVTRGGRAVWLKTDSVDGPGGDESRAK